MQLNELIENHGIKAISEKTMISEDNIECILAEDYTSLSKAKALGFISILEREYNLDVKSIKKNIAGYYTAEVEAARNKKFIFTKIEENNGRSKSFLFIMLALLAYASWYFFAQFDKKTLNTLIPFSEDKAAVIVNEKNKSIDAPQIKIEDSLPTKTVEKVEVLTEVTEVTIVTPIDTTDENISSDVENIEVSIPVTSVEENTVSMETPMVVIENTITNTQVQSDNASVLPKTEETTEVNSSEDINNTREGNVVTTENVDQVVAVTKIILTPVKRLWFGLVNMRTGKRDHFTTRKTFPIDISDTAWLVATSSAPFSLTYKDEIEKFNNGKEHYFKVSKDGIESLSKKAYVRKGGYRKW